VFLRFSDRFKSDPAWRYYEMDASHDPYVPAPEEIARLLVEIAEGALRHRW
jgi:hypothetical protein